MCVGIVYSVGIVVVGIVLVLVGSDNLYNNRSGLQV